MSNVLHLPGGGRVRPEPADRRESAERLARRVLEEYGRTGHLPEFIARQIREPLWRHGDLRRYPEAVQKVVEELQRLVARADRSEALGEGRRAHPE